MRQLVDSQGPGAIPYGRHAKALSLHYCCGGSRFNPCPWAAPTEQAACVSCFQAGPEQGTVPSPQSLTEPLSPSTG